MEGAVYVQDKNYQHLWGYNCIDDYRLFEALHRCIGDDEVINIYMLLNRGHIDCKHMLSWLELIFLDVVFFHPGCNNECPNGALNVVDVSIF